MERLQGMYTIKEMSERFQLPASTIRYYEEVGILENVEHVNGYKRVYDDSHIDRMQAIVCFKNARLSIEDIRQFFEYEKDIKSNSGKIVEMMRKKEEKTSEEIKTLQSGLEHIQKKIKYYSMVDEAITNDREIPRWNDVMS